MLSPHTPNPQDRIDPVLDEYLADERSKELWYEMRKDGYKFVDSHVADPSDLLGKIMQTIAKGERDWDLRRSNGMNHTYGEQRYAIYRDVMAVIEAELPELSV